MFDLYKYCKGCNHYVLDTHQFFETLPSGNRRGTCRKCQYARAKGKGYATYGVKTSRQQRNAEMKYRYGITRKEHDTLHREQKGCCKICGVHENDSSTLHIDHCHSTGKVRGLLCRRCNMGLGHFKDSVSNLMNAIKYLKEDL